jgi:hypothetical protein
MANFTPLAYSNSSVMNVRTCGARRPTPTSAWMPQVPEEELLFTMPACRQVDDDEFMRDLLLGERDEDATRISRERMIMQLDAHGVRFLRSTCPRFMG